MIYAYSLDFEWRKLHWYDIHIRLNYFFINELLEFYRCWSNWNRVLVEFLPAIWNVAELAADAACGPTSLASSGFLLLSVAKPNRPHSRRRAIRPAWNPVWAYCTHQKRGYWHGSCWFDKIDVTFVPCEVVVEQQRRWWAEWCKPIEMPRNVFRESDPANRLNAFRWASTAVSVGRYATGSPLKFDGKGNFQFKNINRHVVGVLWPRFMNARTQKQGTHIPSTTPHG